MGGRTYLLVRCPATTTSAWSLDTTARSVPKLASAPQNLLQTLSRAPMARAPISVNWPPGTVVWARVTGWPWWPALVVPYEQVYFLPLSEPAPVKSSAKVTVLLFRDGHLAVVSRKDVVSFQNNLQHLSTNGEHSAGVQLAYLKAREWIQRHGVTGPLPFINPNLRAPKGAAEDPQEDTLRMRIAEIRLQRMKIDAERIVLVKEIEEIKKRLANAD